MSARCFIMLFGLLLSWCSQAHYARSLELDQHFEQRSLRDVLHVQITDHALEVEDFLLNPAHHHAFTPLHERQKAQINAQEAVWLFARLHYQGDQPLTTILYYDFPLADQVTLTLFDRGQQRVIHQLHTGSDYPFSERVLPYPGFAFPLQLEPGQKVDVFLKVQDAGLVPLQLQLWQQEIFLAEHSKKNILEGILFGLLLALVLFNSYLALRRRKLLYLMQAGFYGSLLLVLATLSGQAFAYLWSKQPEINSAILYVLSGLTLVFLNQFTYQALSSYQQRPWRWLFILNQLLSLLLLFSPLFADGALRVQLLLICSLVVLISNSFISFIHFLQGHLAARFFALVWLCLLLCGGLLMLNEFGLLPLPFLWKDLLLIALIVSLSLISFHYHSQQDATGSVYQKDAFAIEHAYAQAFFQQSNKAIFITSDRGDFLQANHHFYKFIGLSPHQVVKTQLVQELFPDWERLYQDMLEGTVPSAATLNYPSGKEEAVAIHIESAEVSELGKVLCVSLAPLSAEETSRLEQQKLNQLDTLTGLLNKAAFTEKLQQFLQTNSVGTLLQINVLDFQRVNQQAEQAAGDALLRQIASKLQSELNDLPVARLTADTFVALLPNKSSQEAFVQAYRLLDQLRGYRFIWNEHIFRLHSSIGMLNIQQADGDTKEALKMVAQACSQAKSKGYNRIHLYNPEELPVEADNIEQTLWQHKVRQALANNQLVLNVQSIQHPDADQHTHCEVLLRYKADAGHLIPAENFIGAAKQAQLSGLIDRWVIENYFAWLNQHQSSQTEMLQSHINLTADSITDADFIDFVALKLKQYNIDGSNLCFEINEYIAVEYLSATVNFIRLAHQLGCKVCLDNFGCGFSTFNLLRQLPLDFLKLDPAVIHNAASDPLNHAIARSIIDIAKSSKVEPIAPHIEDEQCYQLMRDYGVRYFQGHYFAKPCLLTEAFL